MKKLTALVIAGIMLAGCASSSLLPQMQKWDTHDQVLGGTFIAGYTLDAYQTKRRVFDNPDKYEEVNPFVRNKSQAVTFFIISSWLVLFTADKSESMRTPILILGNWVEWGGLGVSAKW